MTSFRRSTAFMATGTAVSRVTGLLRVGAMAYAIGISGTRLADAYAIANTVPNQIYEIFLGGVLTSVFVPVLMDLKANRRSNRALIGTSLALLALISALVALGSTAILAIYPLRIADPQIAAATRALSADLLLLFAPQIFLYGVCALSEAVLTSNRRFAAPKFVPALNNLVVATMFVLYARTISEQGLDVSTKAKLWLGLGTTLGVAIQAVVLVGFVKGAKFSGHSPDGASGRASGFSFSGAGVRDVVRLSGYVIGYVIINQIGLLAVIAFASQVPGAIVAYQIAFVFIQLPHGLFSVSVNTFLAPDLADHARQNDHAQFRATVATGLRTISFFVLPAAAGYIALAHPITQLVLVRGQTGTADARLIASVIVAFASGLIFFSWFQFLRTCSNARYNTKTPTTINAISVGIHIALMFPLFAVAGPAGIAVGWAISYLFATALSLRSLNHQLTGGLRLATLVGPLTTMLVGSIAAGGAAALASSLTNDTLVLSVGVGAVAGFATYTLVCGACKLPETKMLAFWR